ncbi:MAG: type II secretion system inner membrane protein GspF [bacterium]|nr:type II secretion system inner membrane protein GspF [bacterium]
MAVFRYKTYDTSGKTLSGIIDADSPDHATSKLKGKGLFPFEVKLESLPAHKGADKIAGRDRVKGREITAFTRQMASLLLSGMPLVEILAALSEQTSGGQLKKIIVSIKEKVSSGISLSEAFSDYPRCFSPTFVSLVRAGETGGELDRVLEELADLGEKQEALKGKVMAAMVYPLFMTLVGTLVLSVLFILVIPKIISIFDNMEQSLPLPTKMLVFMTDIVHGYWPFIVMLIMAVSLFMYKIWKTKKGRMLIDRAILKVPVLGNLICRMEVSRFARTFALLLRGGVPLTKAIDISKDVVKSSPIARNIEEAGKNVAEGGELSVPLKAAGLFPPVAVHMIAVGEKGGNLEHMLLNVANSFDREVDAVSTGMASIVEPLLIVIMGIAVGFIALAILLPIFEMNMLVG